MLNGNHVSMYMRASTNYIDSATISTFHAGAYDLDLISIDYCCEQYYFTHTLEEKETTLKTWRGKPDRMSLKYKKKMQNWSQE